MLTDKFAGEISIGISHQLSVTFNLPNGTARQLHSDATKATAYTTAVVAKYLFNELAVKFDPT
jgi:hypothetical protein